MFHFVLLVNQEDHAAIYYEKDFLHLIQIAIAKIIEKKTLSFLEFIYKKSYKTKMKPFPDAQ